VIREKEKKERRETCIVRHCQGSFVLQSGFGIQLIVSQKGGEKIADIVKGCSQSTEANTGRKNESEFANLHSRRKERKRGGRGA